MLESILSERCVCHQEGLGARANPETNPIPIKPKPASQVAEQFSWVPLPYSSPPRLPFPIKSLALSAHVSPRDNSFPSVRQEPSFGPWKGSAFLQQMVTLVGLFFAETDILTTRGTQGPACLPMDQTQQPQLGPFCPWSPPDTDNWPECPDR